MELGNGSGFSFASGHWAIAVADCIPIAAIEPGDALRPGAVVAKHIDTKTYDTSRRGLIESLTASSFQTSTVGRFFSGERVIIAPVPRPFNGGRLQGA